MEKCSRKNVVGNLDPLGRNARGRPTPELLEVSARSFRGPKSPPLRPGGRSVWSFFGSDGTRACTRGLFGGWGRGPVGRLATSLGGSGGPPWYLVSGKSEKSDAKTRRQTPTVPTRCGIGNNNCPYLGELSTSMLETYRAHGFYLRGRSRLMTIVSCFFSCKSNPAQKSKDQLPHQSMTVGVAWCPIKTPTSGIVDHDAKFVQICECRDRGVLWYMLACAICDGTGGRC